MQRRPSVVHIRRGCCKRRTLRCGLVLLLLCLGVGFLRCLFWAGIITALFRLFVIGVFL